MPPPLPPRRRAGAGPSGETSEPVGTHRLGDVISRYERRAPGDGESDDDSEDAEFEPEESEGEGEGEAESGCSDGDDDCEDADDSDDAWNE